METIQELLWSKKCECFGYTACGIQNLLQVLDWSLTLHCFWKATHWFVLDMPTKQHSNYKNDEWHRQWKITGIYPLVNKTWLCLQYILHIYLIQMIDRAKSHLDAVAKERKLYREVCKTSREDLKSTFTLNGSFQPPAPNSCIPPRHTPVKVHYSFDMAQQVWLYSTTYIIYMAA